MSAEGRQPLAARQVLDVLDGVSVLMYVQDPEGRILHANRAACDLVGKPQEEVVGKLPEELFDPVTVERWTEQNRQVMATGRSIDIEDGWGGRTHLTHKTPVFDAEGNAVAVIGLSTEITDRKNAEDALRRSEQHLREAQQIAGVGSWHWDAKTRERHWSTELCRLYGVPPGTTPTVEETLLLIHADDHERVRDATRAALAGEAPMDLDMRITRRDGESRILHCRGSVTGGPDGSPHRLDGTCVDVTDRRRAERRLAEAQRLAHLGSWEWDVARGEISWSREMYRIYGEDPEQFVPTPEVLGERVVDEDRGPIREQMLGVIERGGEFDAFARIRRADGQTRDVRFRGSMVTAPGIPVGLVLGICQDLTDLRLAEQVRVEAVEAERRRAALYGVARIMAGGASLGEALPALVETVVRELDWERGALWLLDHQGELRYGAAWPLGSAPPNPPALPARPVAGEAGLAIPVVGGADVLGLLDFACEPTGRLDDDLAGFAEALGVQVGEFLVRKRAEELVRHQALHDPLTGLPNRVLFFDRLDHAILRLQREHAPLALLFLDFDGFKAVNDRFGHAGGDEVLRRAADRVSAALRAEDTVARFGGDELVVLSDHVAGAAGGAMIAERILEQLSSPIGLDGDEVLLSASIGICLSPVEGATRDALLHTADGAMYQAKAAGRGRYVIAGE